MAKAPPFLALTAGFILFLSFILAVDGDVDIGDLFVLQTGSTDGGCGGRATVLDNWLTEISFSIDVAAIAMDQYDQNIRVRRSLSAIFGIRNSGKLPANGATRVAFDFVRDSISTVQDFFNNRKGDNGEPLYPQPGYWLFCDSTFLSEQQPTDIALDYEGNEIKDDDDQPVPINKVAEYKAELDKNANNKPWWAGKLTTLKAYFFTEHGADYCTGGGSLGVTADVTPYKKGADGKAQNDLEVRSVTICPSSFDGTQVVGTEKYETYKDANDAIAEATNLADVVPRSATLLHEAFHVVHGANFKGEGQEEYDIAKCLAFPSADARINPENYVFFIAHMYHLFGDPDGGNEPWSINRKWDFKIEGKGKNSVFGAFDPGDADVNLDP